MRAYAHMRCELLEKFLLRSINNSVHIYIGMRLAVVNCLKSFCFAV